MDLLEELDKMEKKLNENLDMKIFEDKMDKFEEFNNLQPRNSTSKITAILKKWKTDIQEQSL